MRQKSFEALPLRKDSKLGPGDKKISIQVWRHEDLNMDVTIAPDGTITYPLVGQINVEGQNYTRLVTTLTRAITEYYSDPQVTVNILEIKNQKVLVVGEVSTPSVLQLSNQMSILEALTITGGISPSAKTNNVLLIRGGVESPSLYTIDVESIYSIGNTEQMVYLQKGDIIVVPARTITNLSRYFRDVQSMLAPFVAGSAIFPKRSLWRRPGALLPSCSRCPLGSFGALKALVVILDALAFTVSLWLAYICFGTLHGDVVLELQLSWSQLWTLNRVMPPGILLLLTWFGAMRHFQLYNPLG